MVTYNFAIVYPLLSPLIISSIDTFIDVKTLNGTYMEYEKLLIGSLLTLAMAWGISLGDTALEKTK